MFRRQLVALLSGACLLASASNGLAADGPFGWFSGDWYLKVGAAGIQAPKFEGSSSSAFKVAPLVSLGKHGRSARFSSRNDNISLALMDTGGFRAGMAGKFVPRRDEDDSSDLAGLDRVKMGAEVGGFAEIYPTDWLRFRAEMRRGVRSHSGLVTDVSADAFLDFTETIQFSGGPRLSYATSDYFDAYYGVSSGESASSGLSEYQPGSGVKSMGLGGAVTWRATDKINASVFAEYSRLMGPAADSSLVRERGSRNPVMVGAMATYRFDFSM
ncbi:MipA/OmpV family protein [Aquamicrobium sp. LC103]|uniref:MipA/OmpV family protein n=1 Tax=Aquamicrobium sp. LC103 TaxID=1120658 RepID=UPI00063EA9C3|nr:MipA/OmpV family protein [Aquamicrobium sp. LC103]TKT69177.1 MipA/OmpV family protein [Aquamicrobium sp. LC103]